jgi:indole-3-glycerol phosphate synthase
MNVLRDILAAKQQEVTSKRQAVPLTAFQDFGLYHEPRRPFAPPLFKSRFSIIAEIKKASPSRGVIREDFDPAAIASSYERGGAAALSVLTDELFFQGRLDFLSLVRQHCSLPVLRKDFLIDPYQIHESRAAGADAVLLIVAALGRERLGELFHEAVACGLETLVEVHNEEDLVIALELPGGIIGVNNRDLTSFVTDLRVSLRLGTLIPRTTMSVSESGIGSAGDLQRLSEAGFRAALIGEAFMKVPDPGAALHNLLETFEGRSG